MSQRQVYDQIRRAYSALTRPPRAQLSERIRDTLWGAPAPREGGFELPVAPLPLVAGLVVLLLVVGAVLEWPAVSGAGRAIGGGLSAAVSRAFPPGSPGGGPTSQATPSPSATPTPSASPTPEPTPEPTPSPSATPEPTPAPTAPPTVLPVARPGYSCATQSGGGGSGAMTEARVGAQSGYDRFVVQFTGPVPQFEVSLQASPSFGAVTLQGGAGLHVVLRNAARAGSYGGPSVVRPGFPVIREARLLSDSQGVVEWGLGIAQPTCFHAWTLGSPSRLVIDVSTP